jgi:hypothetical protein
MEPTDRYVPSREGEKILGVKRNLFFYYVDSGQIRKLARQGEPDLYNYTDILKVKEKRSNRRKKQLTTEVDWQKISDLPAILKLDFQVYHNELVGDINLYIAWERKNPKITLLSFEKGNRDNVLAYISLVPLPEEIILSILKGERAELSISPDEVETYDRKGGFTLLAESAVTHPDHPEQLNNVMRGILEFWCEQYPDRYIDKIYAQSATDAGDILIRKLYFSPLYHISDTAYVLDLRKRGVSKIVKRFQECIEEKQEQQASESIQDTNTPHKSPKR